MCVLQILRCISQLELAQMIGTGVKSKYISGGSSQPTAAHHGLLESFDPEGNVLNFVE